MTNKRDLKAFVRYDGSGRVVAGSLILRRQKPKVGKWTEVQGYQCCNAPILTATPSDTLPSTNVEGIIFCDVSSAFVAFGAVGIFTTIEQVVSALNMQCSFIGNFSLATNGTDINVNPSFEIAESMRTCLADLIFEITLNP